MPNSGILLVAAVAVSPAEVTLKPGESLTFAVTGGSGAYAFTLEATPSGATIDPVSGIYTAGPLDDVDDVLTVTDDQGHETKATIHVLSNPPAEVDAAAAQTPTGVPWRSVNLAGGGAADNACDCSSVGAKRSA